MSNSYEVNFYQLTFSPLEKVLPKLVEKAYFDSGFKIFILCSEENQMRALDDVLWTSGRHFLPHDTINCKNPEDHPILLATELKDNFNFDILINLANHIDNESQFKRVVDIFNGLHGTETMLARKRYKTYLEKKIPLKFWKQNEQGSWSQN